MSVADSGFSYEVVADCKIIVRNRGSGNEYTIEDVKLSIIRHGLGYEMHRIIWSLSIKTNAVYAGSTSLPVWDGKYIPSESFLLPSVRLLACSERSCEIVLASNEGVSLVHVELVDEKWNAISMKPTDHPTEMRSLWLKSFSASDVYWDYFLLHFSAQFGHPNCMKIDHASFIDTKYLFTLWIASKLKWH